MAFIEPLNWEVIFIQIFAGSATYFAPIAIFGIITLSAYFRMNVLTMGFMIFVFLLMFSGYVPPSLLVMISIIGGLVIGYTLSKIVKN